MTGRRFHLNSVECALVNSTRFGAYSIVAICMPRQRQIRNLPLAGVIGRENLASMPRRRNHRAPGFGQSFQHLVRPILLDFFGIEFLDLHAGVVGDATMMIAS